jgi:YHS domain-containing protein
MTYSTFINVTGFAIGMLFSSLGFSSSVNSGENDVAIRGYDPVAYSAARKPVRGRAKYTASCVRAIYRFSNSKNRDRFNSDPQRYAPRFGGHCAMSVALNKKLNIDTDALYLDGGKLYLDLIKTVQKNWVADVPGHIKTAPRVWGGIGEISENVIRAEE